MTVVARSVPAPGIAQLTLDRPDKLNAMTAELVQELQGRDLSLPLLIRFDDILEDRLERIHAAFERAIAQYGYGGRYQGVFPVKCNQQRHVVEELVSCGKRWHFGLEAGSKAELLIALSLIDDPEALLICNGYKDQRYIETAILARRLGRQPVVVIEQADEVERIISASRALGAAPFIGIRAKLSARSTGRWGSSVGERAKFGLGIPELLSTVEALRAADLLGELRLLHFHVGSQINDIAVLKDALQEAGQIYGELTRLGAPMGYLDVGGGLGIDYDGTNSTNNASVNYSLQEYANDVIYTIAEACRDAELSMPHIISESGRALTAHHALLLVKVIDVESQAEQPIPVLDDDEHSLLHEMYEDWRTLTERSAKPRKVLEVFHDASFDKDRARNYFNSGVLNLRGLAKAEVIWLGTMNAIYRIAKADEDTYADILPELESALVDRYFCNFSLFQSLPDSWAIDQLFPIMPIHRLDEEPVRRGTLQDVTCDSDGKIDRFVGDKKGRPSLELHEFRDGEDYILGIFLTGAYQEILGDLHNLFGDTNAVHVRLNDQGAYEITDLVEGDTVTEVLNYVQFGASQLLATFRRKVNAASSLTREEANAFIADYVAGLEGCTYLEGEAAR